MKKYSTILNERQFSSRVLLAIVFLVLYVCFSSPPAYAVTYQQTYYTDSNDQTLTTILG